VFSSWPRMDRCNTTHARWRHTTNSGSPAPLCGNFISRSFLPKYRAGLSYTPAVLGKFPLRWCFTASFVTSALIHNIWTHRLKNSFHLTFHEPIKNVY
jgi:hypothetical protein